MKLISFAFLGPISQVQSAPISPPPIGSAGQMIRTSSATSVMSQQIASIVAPAAQTPCTWAMTGFGNSQSRSQCSIAPCSHSRSSLILCSCGENSPG